jgi:hypothetical protein
MTEPGRDHAVDTQRYHCPEHVGWSVEIDTIRLINRRSGAVCRLGYPEAAVWDLLSRGYAHEDLVRLLGVIASVDLSEAEQLVLRTVKDLAEKGFLTQSGNHD